MNQASWKRLKLGVALATLTLALQGFVGTASAADASVAAATQQPTQAELLANDCVSLGTQHAISRNSFNRAKPALINRCEYAVTVSYCIDDDGAGALACGASDTAKRTAQLVQPRAAVELETRNGATLYEKIHWMACRSVPGVTSQLNKRGSGGECVSETSMQAGGAPAAPTSR